MLALLPPLLFVIAWVCALLGWSAPGADGSTPFDAQAPRWMLFLGMGWMLAGNSIPHIFFGEATAKSIGVPSVRTIFRPKQIFPMLVPFQVHMPTK